MSSIINTLPPEYVLPARSLCFLCKSSRLHKYRFQFISRSFGGTEYGFVALNSPSRYQYPGITMKPCFLGGSMATVFVGLSKLSLPGNLNGNRNSGEYLT